MKSVKALLITALALVVFLSVNVPARETGQYPFEKLNGVSFFDIANGAPGITELTANRALGPEYGSVSGSVTSYDGQPIRNALMVLAGGSPPAPQTAQTGNFGTYSFLYLLVGETYIIRVGAKRYRFAQSSIEIEVAGDITNVNFVANPQ